MKELLMDATEAKTNFGRMKDVAEKSVVAVTKRGAVSFYLVSPERYEAMKARMGVEDSALQALSADYDRMVAAMQTAQHAAAVDRLLDASDAELRTALSAGSARRRTKSGARKQAR